jgi:hypothetical protein
MSLTQTALSRRSFLLAATAGTAATAAAVLVKNHPLPTAGTTPRGESKSGYQLTDHIRNYYRTTRI